MKKFAKYILMGITLITVLLLNNNAIGEIANNMKPVVVTASRIEENIDETGSAVSIVTAEDIKQSGATQVKEVLREVTGIDVVSTGAFGGTSSLYMRGANPNHTRMMIDGVKVYDPIRSDGAFNFANLTANNIERIEVIRGGQSSVWGSSAMGGVINIITKKGQEDSEISAKFEGGSHDTYSETVNASGLIGALSYATSFTRTDSEGISKAGNRYGNHEEDGYQNTSFSGRFNYKVSDDIDIGLITRYTNTRFEFDDAAGVGGDDVNRRGISEQTLFSSFIDQDILENWSHHFQTSWTRNVRQDNDDIDIIDTSISDYRRDWFNGVNLAFDWQHIINPVEWDTISTGIQYDREEGKTRTITRQLATNFGYYFENKLSLFDNHLFNTLSTRIDDHSRFGSHQTYKAALAYLVTEDTTLRTSFSTGFKAPSIFQLFSSFGDRDLKPERSKGYDVGVKQELWDDKFIMEIGYFDTKFRNLVEFDLASFTYKNLGKASTKGIESEFTYIPFDVLNLKFGYTYLKAKDEITGKQLVRRAKDKFKFNVLYKPIAKLHFTTNVTRYQRRLSSSTTPLKDYTKIDLGARYLISEIAEVFGRIENVTDRYYEEVSGFGTPGRSFYMGVEFKF